MDGSGATVVDPIGTATLVDPPPPQVQVVPGIEFPEYHQYRSNITGKAEVHIIATFCFNDTVNEVERSHIFLNYHSYYSS